MPNLRHDCDRNGCYLSQVPDWGIYNGCLPRDIRPSDHDSTDDDGNQFRGHAEVNWCHVLFERKKDTPNPGNFRRGQEQALARWASCPGHVVITEILLEPPDGKRIWRIWAPRYDSGWRLVTREEARDWLTRWGKWADNKGPLERFRALPEVGVTTEAPESWHVEKQVIVNALWDNPVTNKVWPQ